MKLLNVMAGAAALALLGGGVAHASFPTGGGGGVSGEGGEVTTASKTFTVSGYVPEVCVLGTLPDINLGTLPIDENATDALSSIFRLVNNTTSATGASVNGGCNDGAVVTITKSHLGMILPDDGDGYNPNTFTNTIPYVVAFNWTGPNAGGSTDLAQHETADATHLTSTHTYGSFLSPVNVTLTVNKADQNGKALLGGTYSDTVTVSLAPQ